MEHEELKNKLITQIERELHRIAEAGIQPNNIDMLYNLIDIHKDIKQEDYWKCKEEAMDSRYKDNYANYGTDYNRDMNKDNYGARARDSKGRYMGRGYDTVDEIYNSYDRYYRGKEDYHRGNYGAKKDTMQSLEYMLRSVVDFINMLKEEAGSSEELELIKRYCKHISEM